MTTTPPPGWIEPGQSIEVPSHHAPSAEMTREELKASEAVIERGKQTFIEVGTALRDIRDRKGYRFEFSTFDEYCKKRWDFGRSYAHRVIAAVEVMDNLLPMGNIPESERQLRPLTALPPAQQREAWQETVETAPAGKVTAKHAESVARKYQPAPKPAPRREPEQSETAPEFDPFPAEHEVEAPDREEVKPDWTGKAISCWTNETDILKWIIGLYNGGCAFDLDPTYSMGRVWQGLPEPVRKSDLHPSISDCAKADARHLEYPASNLDSIYCDLPFVIKDMERENAHWGIVEARFGGFKNWKELCETYKDSLAEFYRILRKDGIVCFKCQDMISGSKFYSAMVMAVNAARDLGFYLEQIFVYWNQSAMPNPSQVNGQLHARNSHCYYLVLRK